MAHICPLTFILSPSGAHKGRFFSDTPLTLVPFSLSLWERGRKTYPRKPSRGRGTLTDSAVLKADPRSIHSDVGNA
jgi:hypothetical protein